MGLNALVRRRDTQTLSRHVEIDWSSLRTSQDSIMKTLEDGRGEPVRLGNGESQNYSYVNTVSPVLGRNPKISSVGLLPNP